MEIILIPMMAALFAILYIYRFNRWSRFSLNFQRDNKGFYEFNLGTVKCISFSDFKHFSKYNIKAN